jgi:MoaA/NifB/PqqE/SkfB family radical SAM enzyme
MPLEKIRKHIFNLPVSLRAAKFFLSYGLIANSSLYKKLVMKKAKSVAEKNKEYKETICIETALTCNSRCIFCGHHNRAMSGIMSMDLFKKIVDECHEYGIRNLTLGVYGEIFTDGGCIEKISYLRKRGLTYGIVTNASLLHQQLTDRLFELGGLTYINFSVNGFSKEVYEKTMTGLNRDTTYKNILYFLKQKEKMKADDMRVIVTAVETKLNKKDYKGFFRFWKRQKGVCEVLSAELMDRMGTEYDGKIGSLGPMTKKTNWLSPCRMLWGPLNVYYDGKVGPCCKDNDKRQLIIGDLTKQTIREISTGEALNNLRKLHLFGKRSSHPICGKCYLNSIWIR